MPVFLSHKSEDTTETLLLRHYLNQHGVTCYVDVLDPSLQTTDDITAKLMTQVRKCTHLMAVVSTETERSWWVPFEIGVASELSRRICTYKLRSVVLPSYLTKWPILSSYAHLDLFIYHYKQDSAATPAERRYSPPVIHSPESFHATLKRSIVVGSGV